jgi:DNA-binding MarR family transcriptional regulator
MSSVPNELPCEEESCDDAALDFAQVLKDDFGWALATVTRAYQRATATVCDEIPGGARGYLVVAAAAQGLATTQGQLAVHLGIDRSVLTYLIDDLEAAGLVTRQADPSDRRNRRIVATDEGRKLWCAARASRATAESLVLAVLGEGAQVFRDLLQRAAVEADPEDGCGANAS